jgi:nicotinate phosphoribosyltransferase
MGLKHIKVMNCEICGSEIKSESRHNKHCNGDMPIIHSLLDTDFYKLSMMQAVFHQFPNIEVEYEFRCRTPGINLSSFAKQIRNEIDHYCSLSFKVEEIEYLRSLGLFKEDFLIFMSLLRLNPSDIKIKTNPFELIINGTWLHTILFETPILAIISEIYSKNRVANFKGNARLEDKINLIKNENIKFADFGSRRRYSFSWHSVVTDELKNELPNQFIGTSNVLFAMMYNLKSIGTMAHEWLQAGQSLAPSLPESQKFMLRKWLNEYEGELAIALTDVINMDRFLKDFKEDYLGFFTRDGESILNPEQQCSATNYHSLR